MKLYYAPGYCSLSPHIALREAGLPFTLELVDMQARTIPSGRDYRQINSKNYVPALELDDGQVLTEGPAIIQYVADQAPQANLAPVPGTMERYRLQEWLNFIATEVHKALASMFNPAQSPEWRKAVEAVLSKRLDWLSEQIADKDYLMGTFTVADGYLFTILNWEGFVGFDLSPWPVLQRYVARIRIRPKVAEALKAEGLA
jgi:glutathione S-transferase